MQMTQEKTHEKLIGSESVVCAELDGEAILLNIDTGLYFGLDPVGTTIWNALTGGATAEEIAAQVAEQFDAPLDQILADVREFLALLSEKGLVRPAEL
jgi:hypothetical protein